MCVCVCVFTDNLSALQDIYLIKEAALYLGVGVCINLMFT